MVIYSGGVRGMGEYFQRNLVGSWLARVGGGVCGTGVGRRGLCGVITTANHAKTKSKCHQQRELLHRDIPPNCRDSLSVVAVSVDPSAAETHKRSAVIGLQA